MAVCASVSCTCYANGRVKEPPYRAEVILNHEGYLVLDRPEGHEHEFAHWNHWEWVSSACEHPYMRAILLDPLCSFPSYHAVLRHLNETVPRAHNLISELPKPTQNARAVGTKAAEMLPEIDDLLLRSDLHGKPALRRFLEKLRRLCSVSIETGNPIRWTQERSAGEAFTSSYLVEMDDWMFAATDELSKSEKPSAEVIQSILDRAEREIPLAQSKDWNAFAQYCEAENFHDFAKPAKARAKLARTRERPPRSE